MGCLISLGQFFSSEGFQIGCAVFLIANIVLLTDLLTTASLEQTFFFELMHRLGDALQFLLNVVTGLLAR